MIGWGRGDYTKLSYLLLGIWCFSLLFMLLGAGTASPQYGKAAALLI